MILGILILSMIVGACAAGAALAAGLSVLTALAVYSASGTLGVLGLVAAMALRDAWRNRATVLGPVRVSY
ncbi:MAG: hypothetical protein ACWA5A_16310 [Marinibacterium sp.]